jgi:23S rRNA (cytidine1920-2'-O)/16S rRNA (cytidine1409-2'-O)-methyltransferase
MANKIRIDRALKIWGLAPSRAKAQELIREGAVEILRGANWETVTEDSTPIAEEGRESVRLIAFDVLEFVSRGGRKLDAALTEFGIEVKGAAALDIGVSTGGFADCLLSRGAAEVVGVDVGRDQLAEKLKSEPRLTVFEGVNARDLGNFAPLASRRFDLVVIDVSFVSLRLILPDAAGFLAPAGRCLALVKPQFEAGPEHLDKHGVVKDPGVHEKVKEDIARLALGLGLAVKGFVPSRLRGQDGNQEYFLYAHRSAEKESKESKESI